MSLISMHHRKEIEDRDALIHYNQFIKQQVRNSKASPNKLVLLKEPSVQSIKVEPPILISIFELMIQLEQQLDPIRNILVAKTKKFHKLKLAATKEEFLATEKLTHCNLNTTTQEATNSRTADPKQQLKDWMLL